MHTGLHTIMEFVPLCHCSQGGDGGLGDSSAASHNTISATRENAVITTCINIHDLRFKFRHVDKFARSLVAPRPSVILSVISPTLYDRALANDLC